TAYCICVSCVYPSDLCFRTFASIYTPSRAPSSENFTIWIGPTSPSVSSLSAKAERQTRSTPASNPYAPAVAAPKISPRRVNSFMEAVPETNLLCWAHRRRRQEREPLGFSARSAHFQFVEQQRRRHHRSW